MKFNIVKDKTLKRAYIEMFLPERIFMPISHYGLKELAKVFKFKPQKNWQDKMMIKYSLRRWPKLQFAFRELYQNNHG